MDFEDYSKLLKDAKKDREKIKNIFERISDEAISNNYKLTADISVMGMLSFFKSVRYKRFIKVYPSEFTSSLVDALHFIKENLHSCSEIPEDEVKTFTPTMESLSKMLDAVSHASDDLRDLLSLYEQEMIIRNSTELRPLYPSDHEFVEDIVDYLYNIIEQNKDNAEVNKKIKSLIMLLPMGFVKNEFLAYTESTLREAMADMSSSSIKQIYKNLSDLIYHTSNTYYMELSENASRFGLDKKPGSLTDHEIQRGIRRIDFFMNLMNFLNMILTSSLMLCNLITDSETKNYVDINKYLYATEMIDSYFNGHTIKLNSEDIADPGMVTRQMNILSLLTDKNSTFIEAGVEQSVLIKTIYRGMGFTIYDIRKDNLFSELFNLFEYNMDDEPSEEELTDKVIKDILAMVEDELNHFPAFFRREKMKYIMNLLPVGFNDIDQVHEYIHMSIDSIRNERLLNYIEALIASMMSEKEEQG
ncbi:MAG: hypothetical protein QME46_00705 [Thermoanaerobacteraceae bacterium]|nr:hypothetical protein [Thermoanaerobacteraceae bacterium]